MDQQQLLWQSKTFVGALIALSAKGDILPLLTPENVMIAPGGLSLKNTQVPPFGNAAPAIYPGYSPPEVYAGRSSPASPVYFVGALMCTLLTGSSPPDVLVRNGYGAPLLNLPGPLAQVINGAMELDENRRISSLPLLLEALNRVPTAPPAQAAWAPPAPVPQPAYPSAGGYVPPTAPPPLAPVASVGAGPVQGAPYPPPMGDFGYPPIPESLREGGAPQAAPAPQPGQTAPRAAPPPHTVQNPSGAGGPAPKAPVHPAAKEAPPVARPAGAQSSGGAQAPLPRYPLRHVDNPGHGSKPAPATVVLPGGARPNMAGQPTAPALPAEKRAGPALQNAVAPAPQPAGGTASTYTRGNPAKGAPPAGAAATPGPKRKKWVIVLVAAAVLLVLAGGVVAAVHYFMPVNRAHAAFANGSYEEVVRIVEEAPLAASTLERHYTYARAMQLYKEGEHRQSAQLLQQLNGFEDSDEKLEEVRYSWAKQELEAGNLENALSLFEQAGGYEDSVAYVEDLEIYLWAQTRQKAVTQYRAYKGLNGFLDSEERAEALVRQVYEEALELYKQQQFAPAGEGFAAIGSYEQAEDYAALCDIAEEIIPSSMSFALEINRAAMDKIAAYAGGVDVGPLLMQDGMLPLYLDGDWRTAGGEILEVSASDNSVATTLDVSGSFYYDGNLMRNGDTDDVMMTFSYINMDEVQVEIYGQLFTFTRS